jgi:hypothetical protein
MEIQKKLIEVGENCNIFKFSDDCKEIEGHLIKKVEGQFGEDYVLKCPSGEDFKVFGCAVIRTKMAEVKEGDYVKIVYQGVQPSTTRKGFNYKDFKVFRSE